MGFPNRAVRSVPAGAAADPERPGGGHRVRPQAGRSTPAPSRPRRASTCIETISIVPADSAKFAKDQEKLRTDSIRRARQNRVRNYLQALKDAATIVDNRAELYQRNQAQQAAS